MSETPRLNLPLVAAQQAQKHVTVNEALHRLDLLVQLAVTDAAQASPPVSPPMSAAYIIPAGATGVWAGRATQIASWDGAGWRFLAPQAGWVVWVSSLNRLQVYTGSGWADAVSLAGATMLGLNATASDQTRLAVASRNVLFNHAGASQQLAINKQAAVDTAGILLQSGFTTHAEIALAGTNDFALKVSPDGSTWRDAIVVDRASGGVRQPFTASAENLLINGDFAINQRRFAGGSLASGQFGHDRWRADGGAASYTVASQVVSLASGALAQTIEPAVFGTPSLAGQLVTVSVEDPSAALSISVGGATGQIAAGAGRRGVSLTVPPAVTGAVLVRIASVAGAAAFSRVKLERGPDARPWLARPAPVEQLLCQRYYLEFSNPSDNYHFFGIAAMRNSTNGIMAMALPTPMRQNPSVSFSGGLVAFDGGGSVTAVSGGRYGGTYIEIGLTFTGGTGGACWPIYASNTPLARLMLSAEL
jgi:hypothetical protein